MRTLVLACFAAIGCYNPSFTECTITCGGMDNKTCPSGFNCDNGYCRSSSGSCAAGPGSDGGGGPLVDADLSQWAYRKPITVQLQSIPGSVTDFPVLVRLTTDADLAMYAQANGEDIYFATQTSGVYTKLKHEIELFHKASGALVAWVKLPGIDQNTPRTFYMLYGNPTASPQMEPVDTWDADYAAVWHLKETMGTMVSDSRGMRHGTKVASALGSTGGLMGLGYNFQGQLGDRFDISSVGLPAGSLTLEFWMNIPLRSGSSRVITTPSTFSYGAYYNGPYAAGSGGGSGTFLIEPNHQRYFQFAPSLWHHVMITWSSGMAPELYLDGNLVSGPTVNPQPPGDYTTMSFGANADMPGPYGTFDEVRLSTIARSATYAKAVYEMGNLGSTAVTVLPAESL